MIKRLSTALAIGGLLAAISTNTIAETAHWGYEGKVGPKHWGKLKDEFETCASGKAQSPINIKDATTSPMGSLKIEFPASEVETTPLNTGHSVQANIHTETGVRIANLPYKLLQFHFHTPSEHQIDGKLAPMEIHFVHQNKEGGLAVIGVMVKEGKSNPTLKSLVERIPGLKNRMKKPPLPIQLQSLLPTSTAYNRYNGSLTTPPCSEGVKWFVMKDPIEASAEEINAFKGAFNFANNRPIQPLNGRTIESTLK